MIVIGLRRPLESEQNEHFLNFSFLALFNLRNLKLIYFCLLKYAPLETRFDLMCMTMLLS